MEIKNKTNTKWAIRYIRRHGGIWSYAILFDVPHGGKVTQDLPTPDRTVHDVTFVTLRRVCIYIICFVK